MVHLLCGVERRTFLRCLDLVLKDKQGLLTREGKEFGGRKRCPSVFTEITD